PPLRDALAAYLSDPRRGGGTAAATSAGPRAPAAYGGTPQLSGARVTEDAGVEVVPPPRRARPGHAATGRLTPAPARPARRTRRPPRELSDPRRGGRAPEGGPAALRPPPAQRR